MKKLFILLFIFITAGYSNTIFAQCGCSNCPQNLPDNTNQDFFVNVSDSGTDGSTTDDCLQTLTGVELNFTHQYLGDLQITISSPCGNSITLVGPIGLFGPTDGTGAQGGSIFNPTFVDGATVWNNGNFTGTNQNVSGNFSPNSGTIASLNCPSNCGSWTLNVTDDQGSDVGDFVDFSLIFDDRDGDDGTELACNSDLPCPGDQDFSAENICTGSPVLWSSGGLCSILGSAGNGVVVDLFIYDSDGNSLPDPGGAPAGYLPTVTGPAHTAGNGPPGTDIEAQNPDITTIGFDFNCANPPTYPFLGEPNLVNETCEPVTYTFFTIVFDYDLETDSDGLCGFLVDCLEYNPACAVERYDVVVYPELVVITRGGGTCNPYAALITEDGTECAVQGNQNTDCSADINYDLTADIPAGTPAGCTPTGLTGSLTCVCCEPPDIAVDPGTQIVCLDEPAFPLTVNPTGGTGTITTYTWTGGTGPLSATNVASPMFDPSFGTGSYNIVVIVDTDDGCQTSTNVIYTVLDPAACCPAQSGKF